MSVFKMLEKVGSKEFRDNFKETLDRAQEQPVVITSAGHARAVVIGLDSWSEEDILWASNPGIWALVEERTAPNRPRITTDELRARIAASKP